MEEIPLYYEDLVTAFIRGRRPDAPDLPLPELLRWAHAQGLKTYKFKRSEPPLPRVRKVLGQLHGLWPQTLLDVGSGRGTFLWPMIDALPQVHVTSLEQDPIRVRDLRAVRLGGIDRLDVLDADAQTADLPERGWAVVTALEVLEHLPDPAAAAVRLLRAAERCLIATVPSQPDDNPEHLRLYTGDSLRGLLLDAGARSVRVEYVLNHIVASATPP